MITVKPAIGSTGELPLVTKKLQLVVLITCTIECIREHNDYSLTYVDGHMDFS